MKTLNKGQLLCINTLVHKLNLESEKADMVAGFSWGRSSSSKDLYFDEAIDMIKYLKSRDPDEVRAEKMRRKIISLAHEMNWRIPGTAKVDMKRLDGWMVNYSILKKKLNQYLYNELPGLVTQFETVYKSFLKGI